MKRVISFIYILFGATGLLSAQTQISDEKMEVCGDSVVVSFKVDASRKTAPRYREVITPYIFNGTDTLYLDPVEVYGRARYMHQRQEMFLLGDKDWELGQGQILAGSGLEYRCVAPLKRWMTSAALGLKRNLSGCNCEKDHSDQTLGQRPQELFKAPAAVQRRIPEYVLADVSREWDFGQDELEVIFKVSKAEIDSAVYANEVTFGKILSAVDRIFSDPHLRLEGIEVAGYASPEGPPTFNNWLGENRAKALISYIIEHRPQYGLTPSHFNIRNGEENWAGLRRMVAESDMKKKDEVLAIIDTPDIQDERRKLWIERLDRGLTWKYLLDNIYPHLRCARFLAVYYDAIDDGATDIINVANGMIRKGHYEQAYRHLLPVSDDMRAFNSIGVALMMQGKFEEAMPWLEKALAGNCPDAQKNIDAIKAEWEYEALQRKEIEEYLNRYN